jgi:hypothetical protein
LQCAIWAITLPVHYLPGTPILPSTTIIITKQWMLSTRLNCLASSSPRQFIPAKVGVRLKTGGPFYIGCELGEAFGLFETYHDPNIIIPGRNWVDGPYRSSMYGVSAGFSFKNGLETGVKFDDYSYIFKQFALRLGYRIKLSK